MTVGELRELLKELPDDLSVVIVDDDGDVFDPVTEQRFAERCPDSWRYLVWDRVGTPSVEYTVVPVFVIRPPEW